MKRITALTTTAIAAATILPASPAHAVAENTTFATYSNGTTSSQYHIFADNIDWSKPVGVVFFFDGDYQNPAWTTVNNPNGTALRNMAAVANSRNMVLIPVVSPDKNTAYNSYITWWEDKDINGNWFRDFARSIIAEKGLDKSNVWTIGQSGGSEFIASELGADSQGSWRSGGGDIMVGGGETGGFESIPPVGYKNIPMYWWIGANDNVTDSNAFGWSAYRAEIAGKAYYDLAGFTNTHLTMVPNTNHYQYNHAQILEATLAKADHVTWGDNAVGTQSNGSSVINTFDPQPGYNAMTDYYYSHGAEATQGFATDRPFFSINNGIIQNFDKTTMYWTAQTGAHTVRWGTGIGDAFAAHNFENGLGYPTSDEEPLAHGAVQHFTKANAYWTAETGTKTLVANGGIEQKWQQLGGAEKLGFPVTSEQATPNGSGAYATFIKNGRKTTLYWSESTGAHVVVEGGAIQATWQANGGVAEHGYPVTDEVTGADGITRVTFQDGLTINWTAENGTWITVG